MERPTRFRPRARIRRAVSRVRFVALAKKLSRESRGSFTIEASLVFPVVLLATVAFVFFSLYIYAKGSLYQAAAVTADRAAFAWDNSHKDPLTGAFAVNEQDGLYWRVFQDRASGIFSFADGGVATVELPEDAGKTDLDMPQRKLMKAAQLLPGVEKAMLSYTHRLFDRTVSVRLTDPFHRPDRPAMPPVPDRIEQEASAKVVDPVELIRTVEFVRLYASGLKGKIFKEDAEKLLAEPELSRAPAQFRGHDEDVVPYLKQLVNGQTVEMPSEPGNVRVIDALDKSGVAHQAFCTYSKSNLLERQLPKDVYLLQQGKVNGVVWHFFVHCRGKQPKPSAALTSELQRNGIVVVIHD